MALLAAAMIGVPRVILEPNANPGMANRAVGPLAQRVFLAFESAADSFTRSKVRVVGTPIRKAFLDGVQQSQEKSGPFHVLIFGGSQGAKAMNTAVIEGLPELMTQLPTLTVTHQTGESDHARVAEAYRRAGIVAEVTPFLYDMPAALRQADLVVARAGAMTVAELTACGKPAILIPLPTAIYDHQMRNAKVMEAAGAAVVLPQAALTGALLARTVVAILGDPERVRVMGTASMAMRKIDAAEVIVRECYALMEGHHDVNRSGGAAGV
jgi:UDP-N-acetylglucosamine--N-acetylmuramyl-(pentapeptide) pyrophosphoryl-undecaprenol N-acetylglucosamine transferase